jgi:hypothetical protein
LVVLVPAVVVVVVLGFIVGEQPLLVRHDEPKEQQPLPIDCGHWKAFVAQERSQHCPDSEQAYPYSRELVKQIHILRRLKRQCSDIDH